ncbi:MAG: hypothetical protein AAFP04_09140 [Myxococcota bacterium]
MGSIRTLAPQAVAASQPAGSDLVGLIESLNRGDQDANAPIALIQEALRSPELTPVGRVAAIMRLRLLRTEGAASAVNQH